MRILAAILLILTAIPAYAADVKDGVTGYWLTENKRAVIEIEECKSSVCGYVYWIIEGGLQFDENNPLEELRDDPICGMQILKDFTKTAPGDWDNGTIYKADDGDTYKANLELLENGTLKLRGYVGAPIFGKTQIWTKVDRADYKACQRP